MLVQLQSATEETSELEGDVKWTACCCHEMILIPAWMCNMSGNTFKEWEKNPNQ